MKRHLLLLIALAVTTLVACSQNPLAQEPPALEPVTLAMGFIPNVQFAPFYVAAEKGYFAEEGIEIQFDYGMENDLLQLVGADELQFAIGSGEQVILARSQELPVRYVANVFREFPVGVVSLTEDLTDLSVLEGKTVGLPGLFGANYIGWLALANAAQLDQSQIQLEPIGFNQIPVLVEGQVDAAVVYVTNEPVQLRGEGYEPSVVRVADYADLVSNGLITNERTIAQQPELVEGLTRAILRGVQDTLANPEEAFEITTREQWVPEAGGENAAQQRAVLEASLPIWQNDQLGQLPDSAWELSQQVLLDAELLSEALPLDELYTNEFAASAMGE